MQDENAAFLLESIYKDPVEIFNFRLKKINEIKDDCIYVLDTNVLLLPYKIKKENLNEIKKVYENMISENRLFLPAIVAREYGKNRVKSIETLYQSISAKKNIKSFQKGSFPILNEFYEYKELCDMEKYLDSKIQEYKEKIDSILKIISEWARNDPVNAMYGKLFTKSLIVEINIKNEDILKELDYRYKNKIAPGFKDSKKGNLGIGDFMIWKSILFLAEKYKKDLVFITEEKKSDWWHCVNGIPLYPRYELIEEYRKVSDGKSFHLINLTNFLNLVGASNELLNNISELEQVLLFVDEKHSYKNKIGLSKEDIIEKWLDENYTGEGYQIGYSPRLSSQTTIYRFEYALIRNYKPIYYVKLRSLNIDYNEQLLEEIKFFMDLIDQMDVKLMIIFIFNSISDFNTVEDVEIRLDFILHQIKLVKEIEFVIGYIENRNFLPMIIM